MRKLIFVAFALFFCVAVSFARNGRCGTDMLIQNNRALQADPTLSARTVISDAGTCTPEDYYDTVYSRTTDHFQIFYTLKGPHKTTEEFIDSLEVYAESAYKFHTKNMGMLAPLGQATTLHYLQKVKDGLYPIEVIDIDYMRNTWFYLKAVCHGCYGVTIPHRTQTDASVLLIDNDFRYTPDEEVPKKDSVNFNDKVCKYNVATEELTNELHDYSYATQWDKALRVTTIHELYHAIQVRYLDLYRHSNFWFEASATGIEEIAAPDIDDYYSYLPSMFQMMGTPLNKADLVESPYLYTNLTYGTGIFLMYLYNHVDKKADKYIWESFSKKPSNPFINHFISFAKSKKLSADSTFHDFATRLAFSGKKTSFLDTTQWITGDQYFWPEFKYKRNNTDDTFNPVLDTMAYTYVMNGKPDLNEYKGNVSVVLFKGGSAKVSYMPSVYSAETMYAEAYADSSIDSLGWVFSRFDSDVLYPLDTKTIPMHAYPMPWREGSLCFTPLPENKNFVEIRNRRGDLVTREKYSGRTLCLDESTVRNLMVPGVYRFRAGSSGKTKDFLIIY